MAFEAGGQFRHGGRKATGARGGARPIGELVSSALRGLGVPSRAVSNRLLSAWAEIADPAWAGRARPVRLFGGALVVGVSSAPLRLELAEFHAERLLAALRARLPQDPITSLRFSPELDAPPPRAALVQDVPRPSSTQTAAPDSRSVRKTPEGRS